MVLMSIIKECTRHLLGSADSEPPAEDVETLCHLLTTIGPKVAGVTKGVTEGCDAGCNAANIDQLVRVCFVMQLADPKHEAYADFVFTKYASTLTFSNQTPQARSK